MRIEILDRAEDDLVEGFEFYENREAGIGQYFLDSLASDIRSLAVYAGIHSLHFDGYYRLLSRRFPFAVYYKIRENTVFVYAVLDCRRNPAWTRKRLDR